MAILIPGQQGLYISITSSKPATPKNTQIASQCKFYLIFMASHYSH